MAIMPDTLPLYRVVMMRRPLDERGEQFAIATDKPRTFLAARHIMRGMHREIGADWIVCIQCITRPLPNGCH